MSNKNVFVAPNQKIDGALVWHTEKRKVNSLLPYEENPRTISDKQMADLKKSLKQFNLVEIPAVDTDGKIIAGHQRIKALQILDRGEEEIDVRVPNRKLTEEEYKKYLLTSNAVTGDWDYEKLRVFDPEFLVDVGFEPIEIADIWDTSAEIEDDDFDEKKELAGIKEVTTKLGDLIELGGNRLICGDSTDLEVLKKLFGDERASLIYSDPVYNLKGGINYSKGLGMNGNYGGNVNDNRTDKEYEEFLRKSMLSALAVSKKDLHIFYWCAQSSIWQIQTLYREFGIENRNVCLWLKNSQNPLPSLAFNRGYEPAVYGTIGRPYLAQKLTKFNEVMNKEMGTGNALLEEVMDVWPVKRLAGKDYHHATSKPPKLAEKAILRCSKPGDIILDSFSGSGSTLIAGEQLKRRVYTVELEPIFCDLAIKRWEKLTGLKAKIIRDEEAQKS